MTPFGEYINARNDYFLSIPTQGIVLGSKVWDLEGFFFFF